MGCVFYEILTYNHAFEAHSLNALAQKILRGRHSPIPYSAGKDIRELITSMLNLGSSARPTLTQVLQKSFLKKRIQEYCTRMMTKHKKGLITDQAFKNLQKQVKLLAIRQILCSHFDIPNKTIVKPVTFKKK